MAKSAQRGQPILTINIGKLRTKAQMGGGKGNLHRIDEVQRSTIGVSEALHWLDALRDGV